MSIGYVQTNTFYLAGSGVIMGATNASLTSFSDIYANVLTMASFGSKGYITFEPDTNNEEAATFTSVTLNPNGTFTLGNLKSALAQSPYTESVGLVRSHAGGTKVVVTDNVAFWNTFGNKENNETINAVWGTPNAPLNPNDFTNKFYVDNLVIAGAPDASTTQKGIGKVSVAPVAPTNPIFVGDNDPRVPTQSEKDAMAGTSGTPSSTNPFVTQNDTSNAATMTAITISFTGPDTISDSGNGFITAGLQIGQTIVITGSASNNVTVTIKTLAAGVITTDQATIVNEAAGASVTISVPTIDRVVRYTSTSQVEVPVTPVVGTDAASKSYVDSSIIANAVTGVKGGIDNTRLGNAASGIQNVAHGLGKIPTFVEIDAVYFRQNVGTDVGHSLFDSSGTYDGVNTNSYSHTFLQSNGINTTDRVDTTNIVYLRAAGNGAGDDVQAATVTVDATNIILSWSHVTAVNIFGANPIVLKWKVTG